MRRHQEEEHANNERWMVSYADFITLLFAFFVVMYSISSVNEGKYKVLTESLMGVFSQAPKTLDPIQLGEVIPRSPTPTQVAESVASEGGTSGSGSGSQDPLEDIADAMQAAFGELISVGDLRVHANELWIEIELSSSLLFPSGDALPLNSAFDLIERIAGILAPYDNPIHVEGFTDNLPIRSRLYPTNWELSAARAATVVRMLSAGGIEAGRLANRRVVLLVSRYTDRRHQGPEGDLPSMRQARSEAAQDVGPG